MFDEDKYNQYLKSYKENELPNGKFECPLCHKEYSKYGILNHIKYHFGYESVFLNKSWNKNTKLSATVKQKISEAMKKAHKEGRAYNIGYSRHRLKASYPEKFIMKIIKNELNNKFYKYNYQFKQFELDFAWLKLKKYIEIGGDQHYRFEDYHQRDIRKDKLLADNGWKVLRIRWKDIFNNTQLYIEKIKKFIDEDFNVESIESYNEWLNEQSSDKKPKIKRVNKIKEFSKEERVKKIYNNIIKNHKRNLIIEKLKNSNIDFSKFGWVKEASAAIGISENKGRKWILNNCPELLNDTVFIRGNVGKDYRNKVLNNEIEKYHEIALKINKIIDDKIDYNIRGGATKIAKIIGTKSNRVKSWLERWYPQLLSKQIYL